MNVFDFEFENMCVCVCAFKEHPLPYFCGAGGPLIQKRLIEIEHNFCKLIDQLKNLKYNILDITSTSWHQDYTKFKNGMKDLDVANIPTIFQLKLFRNSDDFRSCQK